MPTMLEILGVKPPPRVTGQSLVSLIDSNRSSGREMIVTGWGEHASIRTAEWNYVGRWSSGRPFEELYRVRQDPGELTNVADKQSKVVQDFRGKLKQYIDNGWPITKGTFAQALA